MDYLSVESDELGRSLVICPSAISGPDVGRLKASKAIIATGFVAPTTPKACPWRVAEGRDAIRAALEFSASDLENYRVLVWPRGLSPSSESKPDSVRGFCQP